jgi:hypothetical protein
MLDIYLVWEGCMVGIYPASGKFAGVDTVPVDKNLDTL